MPARDHGAPQDAGCFVAAGTRSARQKSTPEALAFRPRKWGHQPQTACAASLRPTLAQRFLNVAERKDRQEGLDACALVQPGELVLVEMRHFFDRELRFPGQQFDDSLLIGLTTLRSEHAGARASGERDRKPGTPVRRGLRVSTLSGC